MKKCNYRGTRLWARSAMLLAVLALASVWAVAASATPLDDYVAAPDDHYKLSEQPTFTIQEDDYTATIWSMTSQKWMTEAETSQSIWQHDLTIVVPRTVDYSKAMMFVAGGGNGGEPRKKVDGAMAQIAVDTKSVVAVIHQIPNQPIRMPDEKDERYIEKGRKEDEFIAYTWDKFMTTGNATWLARLPMTKAVVRAMDSVQKLIPQIDGFVVCGASKRGWTTWTVGAVDKRVVAIIPAVIDVLNVEHSMQHHFDVYGYWADAVAEYNDMQCFQRIHTPEFRALNKIVDPFSYVDRYTMPKYILASTGDQFFLPDSSQFYFNALKGEKYMRYVPNTDHGLGLEAYLNLAAFYEGILTNTPRPTFTWTKEPDGSLRVKTDSKPAAVKMWQAFNPNSRNFRLDTIGPSWTSTVLADQGDGVYFAQAPKPEKGFAAFMVELEYPSGLTHPFKFTTEVSVVPQKVIHRNVGGSGMLSSVGEGKDKITVVEVTGDRYQMGYWYGKLLAEQISKAWNGFLVNEKIPQEIFKAPVEALWNSNNFDTVAWESELRGVADGCYDGGHPEITFDVMQKMLAVADISEHSCSLFAAWGKATVNGDLYQLRNLDWSMTSGLQDYPVIAVYNPTDGKRHAVVGFAGLIGAVVGGMNQDGLAVSEIQGHFGDKETLNGMPFPVLLRDILYYDTTLDQSLERMKNATRTNQYHYAVGDPAAPDPMARLIFSSNTRLDLYTDDNVVTKHPVVEPTPFYEKLEDALYWKKHNGGGNPEVYEALKARYGALDAQKSIEVAQAAGVDGTLVSIVYHNTGRDFYVAFAEGSEPAHKQGYVHFDLNASKK